MNDFEETMEHVRKSVEEPLDSKLIDAARLIGQSEDGKQTTVWAPAVPGFTPSLQWMEDAIKAARGKRLEEIRLQQEAVAAAAQLAGRQVYEFASSFGVGFWDVQPKNPANRRTFHIGGKGKKKFFVEYNGQLVLRDGASPWT